MIPPSLNPSPLKGEGQGRGGISGGGEGGGIQQEELPPIVTLVTPSSLPSAGGESTYVAMGPPPLSPILMPAPDEDPDETVIDQVLALLARTEIEEFGLVPPDHVEVDYSKNLGVGRGFQNWGFGGNNNGVYRATVEGIRDPLVVKMIDDMGEDTVREIRNYTLFSLF